MDGIFAIRESFFIKPQHLSRGEYSCSLLPVSSRLTILGALMYQHPLYQRRPRRMGSYFLPFLSLIIIGLIVVLVFQIVGYFQEKRAEALQNKTAVKVVAGKAEMKIWGVDQWTASIDGSILNEGDMIRTSPGSRVILTMQNGGLVRLNSETEIELTGLKSRDSQDEASFALKNGEIWLKRSSNQTVRTTYAVSTPHLDVKSLGTIFDVANNAGKEYLRVIEGKVNATVKVEDPDSTHMRSADTIDVALGQEISIGQNEIAALQNRKPVELLALLADDFRQGDWYAWNRSEDAAGNSGVSVADAVAQQTGKTIPGLIGSGEQELPPTQVGSEIAAVLSTPEIVSPSASQRTTRSQSVTVSGKTSAQTEKIEVTSYIGGKADSYALQKYTPGSENWLYVVSSVYGNLVPGPNRFTIVAIGKNGQRSDSAEIVITYDKPKEPADLSAPVVLSFNGAASSETTEDSVKVEGKIGKGIAKMFVDDFALTRYVFDSGNWLYYAKTGYGNLKEGKNVYHIYGVDSDGNKTPVTEFTITKNPAPAAEPSPQPPATPAPSPSTPKPPL